MRLAQRYKSKLPRRYLRAFRTRFSIFPIMNARARTDRRRNEHARESLFRRRARFRKHVLFSAPHLWSLMVIDKRGRKERVWNNFRIKPSRARN